MSSTIPRIVTTALVAGAVGLGGAAIASATTPTVFGPVVTGDTQLAADLAFNREEERLARDLYQLFSDTYAEAKPFSMIVTSEERHFDAVGRLLTTYDVADPSAGREAGSYADPDLQALYDQWKVAGLVSQTEAAKVGVALEERDIADLEKSIANATQDDVKRVLGRLLAASKNHLAAFTDAADGSYDGTGTGPRSNAVPGQRGDRGGTRQGAGLSPRHGSRFGFGAMSRRG